MPLPGERLRSGWSQFKLVFDHKDSRQPAGFGDPTPTILYNFVKPPIHAGRWASCAGSCPGRSTTTS